MAATETKIKQIAEKLDTLSPKQLDEVKHYSEYLLSTQEQRTKEKHLQYVSILRGIVSSFERVAITWDNDFLINSEIGYLYRAGRDFIRTSKDSFYAEIRKAITLWENYLSGSNEFPIDDEDYFQFVLRCFINYHKMTVYGTECDLACKSIIEASGFACEFCEKNARPKEEIKNDIYLEALQETLRLLFIFKNRESESINRKEFT